MNRAAWIALLVWACALLALGAQVAGFSHVSHPVALAGMSGVAGARLFNALVFVLPGALLVLASLDLRASLPSGAGWMARIGANLLALSALAFAAQGLLPLDPLGYDEGGSRLHASAWMAWWIAFAAGAPAFAAGARGRRGLAVAAVAVAAVLACSLFAAGGIPGGIAQRLACAAWFGWFCHATAVSRDAA